MTNENATSEQLDPSATLRQASALAAHLRQIGVQWLPLANPEQAEKLAESFDFARHREPPDHLAAHRVPQTPPPSAGPAPTASPLPPSAGSAAPARPAPATAPGSHRPAFSLSGDPLGGAENYPGTPLSPIQRAERLAAAAEQVAACTRCEILAKCRTNTVFGEGNASPRFVFFGEGPGHDEDLSGRPFVGKAGQLLTKMIEACRLSREQVYIMNTVKCRPPNNRNPEPAEIENCREYFEEQLQLLRPEYIVCLGLVSAQALLKTKLSVGRMRGKFHQHFESKVLVTYHPSYLLRTPAAKKAAWDDLQLMLRDAGLI
jgi:DNA polymerase